MYKITIFIFIFLIISGCSSLDLNQQTKTHIESLNKGTIRFAVVGDSKPNFELYWKTLDKLLNDKDIDFVVHVGDFTDWSWPWEYYYYKTRLLKINKNPRIIHCMGNHDYRLFGTKSFKKIFGECSFCAINKDYGFVFLRNVYFTGYRLVEKDIELLYNILEKEEVKNVVVFMHAPPLCIFKDLVPNEKLAKDKRYKELLKSEKIKLCFYGHYHAFVSTLYKNQLHIITGGMAPNLHECKNNLPYSMYGNHYLVVEISRRSQ